MDGVIQQSAMDKHTEKCENVLHRTNVLRRIWLTDRDLESI